MPDRMSNIVLFETEEEVKAYKSVLEKCYGMNVEVYVRCLQEKFPKLEEYSIESQSRVIVIKALTTAWLVTGMQRTIDQKNLSQCDAERMIMSNTLACVALSIKYLCAPQIEFAQVIQEILKKDFGGVSKNESVEEYIKNYNENWVIALKVIRRSSLDFNDKSSEFLFVEVHCALRQRSHISFVVASGQKSRPGKNIGSIPQRTIERQAEQLAFIIADQCDL